MMIRQNIESMSFAMEYCTFRTFYWMHAQFPVDVFGRPVLIQKSLNTITRHAFVCVVRRAQINQQ